MVIQFRRDGARQSVPDKNRPFQTRSAVGRCRPEQGLRASGGWCRYLTVAGWWLTIGGFRFSVGGWRRRLAVGSWRLVVDGFCQLAVGGWRLVVDFS